ncbi:anaerobic ribonucleoside-triphosphate reductase activating protein [Candidatus Woesearchaeota archaeon]|nr:anaerobic ribonucleoside-triphosphate reductase activating protein [Candidatus Woesearchaeota archaeon]
MVTIKGWQKTSLIDYSPYTASVIFTGGCSFNCGYCHNPELVVHHSAIDDIKEKDILDYLKQKKMWVDGVCITGGEPTIHPDLPKLIDKIKKIGMNVKLDTNGSNPPIIEELLRRKLVDYFAMDIKNVLDKYDDVAGVKVDKEKIKKSIDLIKNSGVDHEFRTTVVPGLVGKKEIFLIGKMLKGSKKFVIQNFRGTRPLIDSKMQEIKPYSMEQLEEMKEIASEYFEKVEVRN